MLFEFKLSHTILLMCHPNLNIAFYGSLSFPSKSRYGDMILESLLTPLWSIHEPLGAWLVWFSPKRQCLWELKQGIVNSYFVFWGKVSPCSPSCPGTYTPRQGCPWTQRSLSLYLPRAERKGVCHQVRHGIVKFLKKDLMGPPNFFPAWFFLSSQTNHISFMCVKKGPTQVTVG